MTAIVGWLSPESVLIGMDTLCVGLEDGGGKAPINFISKIFPLSHMRGVMCGAGDSRIIAEWHKTIHTRILGRSIFLLDDLAPELLPEIAASNLSSARTCIYHFGFDEDENRFRGFLYESTDGYKSKEKEYGLFVRPGPWEAMEPSMNQVKMGQISLDTREGLQTFFAETIIALRKFQDSLPPDEVKTEIGGEIHWLLMNSQGYSIETCRVFDDHMDMFAEMCANIEVERARMNPSAVNENSDEPQ